MDLLGIFYDGLKQFITSFNAIVPGHHKFTEEETRTLRCPSCQILVATSVDVCPSCGHEFKVEVR
jgi:hypothetical protein